MRALILAADAYGGHGGIAQYTRDLARAIRGFPGCREVVVLPRFRDGEPGPLPDGIRQLSGAANSRVRYLAAAVRLLAPPRFDLVVCGHLYALPLARLLGAAHRAPVVLFIYGIEAWEPPRRPLSARLAARMAGRPALVVSITRLLADRFAGWSGFPRARIGVIPPTVELARFGPGPRDPELEARFGLAGRKVVLAFGRMDATERYKGFDELLRGLPALRRRVPAAALLFLGDGDDRPRLERLAAELGVADRVTFAGRVPEDRKPDYYRLGDVFAMPARDRGGFGIVYLEALASGLPVVASRVDGSREALLDGELGWLVDPAVPAELEAALVEALANPKRASRERLLAAFGPAAFADRVHGMLRGLGPEVGGGQPPATSAA